MMSLPKLLLQRSTHHRIASHFGSPFSKTSCNRLSTGRTRSKRRKYYDPKKTKKILFQSLGCPRNFVDTEIMLGVSVQGGLDLTQDVSEADYLVVNTCGFLESARDESKSAIEELIETKKSSSKLIVTGCMVNLHKDQILKEYPQVDSILGSGAVDKVMDTIQKLEESDKQMIQSSKRRSFLEKGETPRFIATPPHYSYLKIAEGCKKSCSFCIIPKIKGRLQSKPIDQLVEEYKALLDYGSKEVILIAQDLGDFGKDLKDKSTNLANLLTRLLQASNNEDVWLRLLYLYPDEITTDIVDLMESDHRICRYLDMPIQHSHNDMLKSMRRKTTSQDIRQTILNLRDRLPDIHIRTSLMVGFPGETDEHFEDLLSFVKEFELENVGVFKYSDENLAYSSRLPGKVSEEVKEERYHRLMEAQLEIVKRKNQERVKRRDQLHVVIEGMQNGKIVGRYAGQCPDIDGQVIIEGSPDVVAGERYFVEIHGFENYDLIGRVIH